MDAKLRPAISLVLFFHARICSLPTKVEIGHPEMAFEQRLFKRLSNVLCSGGTEAGYVLWSLDGKQLVKIDAHALRNRHGIGTDGKPFTVTTLPSLAKLDSCTFVDSVLLHFMQQVHDRLISKEPMYLLFNIAISDYWKVQDPCASKPVLGLLFKLGINALVLFTCTRS